MSDEKPDWEFWKNKNTVKLWEAAFLSCGIDPDSQSYRDILSFGLDNQKAEKCLRLLKDSLFLPQFFRPETLVLNISDSNLHSVPMAEFAAWCILVDLKIPPELAALAKASQQAALTVKVKPVPVAMPSGDDWRVKARTITDRVALERYTRGEREITARNICDAVATELGKDSTTHGNRGQRSSGNVRNNVLKGWKFTPPTGTNGTSGTNQ